MLRIKDFNTVYWGFIRTASQPYPCHPKVNAFVGPSGGGKTTNMDALRIALGDARFENNRTMDHYIHPRSNWAIVKVSFWNRQEEGRPFFPFGFKEEEITVCVRLSKEYGKCDREYYLFDGEFNDVIDLGQNNRLYKNRRLAYSDYMKKLEEIGITRSFRRLMMMRPEDVQNTVDLSSEQLFDRVLELKGDKAIQAKHDETQDKFRTLRQVEEETARELFSAQQKLLDYEHKKTLFEKNEKDKAELEKIKHLHLKRTLWDSRNELENQRKDHDKTVTYRENLVLERNELTNKLSNLKNTLENEKIKEKDILSDQQHAVQEKEIKLTNFNQYTFELDKKSKEIVRLREIPEESLDLLQKELNSIKSQFEFTTSTLHGLDKQKIDLVARINTIRSGQNDLPDWVRKYQNTLNKIGIPAIMLADCISIQEEYSPWLEAIEGLLGHERFRTIVLKSHYLQAKTSQESLEYHARVSLPKAAKTITSPNKLKGKFVSLRSVLNVEREEAIGGYLNGLFDIYLVETVEEGHALQQEGYKSLTKKGLLQDKDGSLFYKSRELYCGRVARERYLAKLEEELSLLNSKTAELTFLKSDSQVQMDGLKERIIQQKQRINLPTIQLEEEDLYEKVKQAEYLFLNAKQEYERMTNELSVCREIITQISTQVAENNAFLQNHKEKIKQADASISAYRGYITKCIQSVSEAEQKLYEKGYDQNDLEFLDVEVTKDRIFECEDGSEWTKELLELREKELEQRTTFFAIKYSDITPMSMALVGPQRKQVSSLHESFEKAKSDREEWEFYLAQAKTALKNHVRETMNQYIEEFINMANLLGAKAWGKLDQEGENYTQWRLHLKLAFDGKDLKPYSDPIFSKGQRAAISIMLLLSAVNNRREGMKNGIMFLDEPTSRVDDSRANEIGMILQRTNIQYFITHQISASLQSVEWIDHAYVTSKLREGEDFADDPIFESRRIGDEQRNVY